MHFSLGAVVSTMKKGSDTAVLCKGAEPIDSALENTIVECKEQGTHSLLVLINGDNEMSRIRTTIQTRSVPPFLVTTKHF